MTRAGRKRKLGARYKSGDIKIPTDNVREPAIWNRMKHQAVKFALDPRWQTRWGELYFHDHITETQAEAAARWAKSLARYDAINEFHRSIANQSMERQDRGQTSDPDPEDTEAFLKRHGAAHDVLVGCGKLIEHVVSDMCRGYLPSQLHFGLIRTGLSALARYYGPYRTKDDSNS